MFLHNMNRSGNNPRLQKTLTHSERNYRLVSRQHAAVCHVPTLLGGMSGTHVVPMGTGSRRKPHWAQDDSPPRIGVFVKGTVRVVVLEGSTRAMQIRSDNRALPLKVGGVRDEKPVIDT